MRSADTAFISVCNVAGKFVTSVDINLRSNSPQVVAKAPFHSIKVFSGKTLALLYEQNGAWTRQEIFFKLCSACGDSTKTLSMTNNLLMESMSVISAFEGPSLKGDTVKTMSLVHALLLGTLRSTSYCDLIFIVFSCCTFPFGLVSPYCLFLYIEGTIHITPNS